MGKKSAVIVTSILAVSLMMTGCGSNNAAPNNNQQAAPNQAEHQHDAAPQAPSSKDAKNLDQYFAKSESDLSQQHSVFIDNAKKQVKIYATVNGKYLVDPTRHGMNWVDGKYGNQAVFNTYSNPLAFFKAMKDIGGVPAVDQGGDASKEFNQTPEGKTIKGDSVKVSITWQGAGKDYDINDVMVDSTGKKLDYHYGGNHDAAENMMTGCYMCFDSCPVGITSNANEPVDTFKNGKAEFHGNGKVLPKDGTPVVLTYSLNK
jgi:hypothetical protein